MVNVRKRGNVYQYQFEAIKNELGRYKLYDIMS